MNFRMKVVQGALVVRPSGELSESAASELHAQILKELAPEPRDVILSMTGVETIAIGALPYLFRIQKQTRQEDNRFVVVGAPDPVLRLFEKTNVTGNLDLAASEEDAFRATVP